ncbi:MAG: nucleotidyltransferase domain-containing protein, partial [Clostridia bacterium]
MDYLKRNIEISKKIVNEFKKDERIEGVMNLGGIARGFADIDSDIDIAVFSNKQLENFTLGET